MQQLIVWLSKNKEWFFSGVGVLLLATVFGMVRYLFNKGHSSDKNTNQSTGGKSGDSKVTGNGIAIGGPGGRSGKNGKGGDGGSAEVKGDGLAAGGAGGSIDSDNLWPPPAQSGYEIAMEKLRQPVDPQLRKYGRGGMSAGY